MWRPATFVGFVSRLFVGSVFRRSTRFTSVKFARLERLPQTKFARDPWICGGATPLLAFLWPFTNLFFSEEKDVCDFPTVDLFNQVQEAIRSNHMDQADRLLHDLLKHLHASYSKGILTPRQYADHRLRVYSELANVQLVLRKLQQAEPVLKRIIQESHQEFGVPLDDPMILELSLKLAMVYAELGRLEDADNGFTYCVNRLDERLSHPIENVEELKNWQALCGLCHGAYAEFLYKTGSLEPALKHAQSALNMAQQLYSNTHLNYLHLCLTNALILTDLKRFSEARVLIDQVTSTCVNVSENIEVAVCKAHALFQRIRLDLLEGQRDRVLADDLLESLETLLNSIRPWAAEIQEELDRLKVEYKL